jgi:tetratricopeptide (TPR) repeat protein
MSPSRRLELGCAAVAFAGLAAIQILGAGHAAGALWGANGYAFLPPIALWIALGLAAVLIAAILLAGAEGASERRGALVLRVGPVLAGVFGASRKRVPLVRTSVPRRSDAATRSTLTGPALVAAFVVAANTWRCAHLLLGDGVVVVSDVISGHRPAPLEPLASWLQQAVYRLALAAGGAPGFATAWSALATASVVLGGAFAALLWGALGMLEPPSPAGTARAGGAPATGGAASVRIAAWALLASQGYVLLFFGYVENYASLACGLALYVLAAYRAIRDSSGARWPGLALALALLLHFGALLLLPSFLYLVALELRAGRGAAARRDLTLVLLVVLVAAAVLTASAPPGLALAAALRAIWGEQIGGFARPSVWIEHGARFANEALIVGPLAIPLLVGGWIAARAGRTGATSPRARFSIALGLGAVAGLWLAGPSNLGAARNWDLMAPFGFVAAFAGLALLRDAPADVISARALAAATVLSLVQTLPWIAVNADEPRAAARFMRMSLPRAEAAATLGYWYGLTGRSPLAEQWLHTALAADPREGKAWAYLGILDRQRGRDSAAVTELSIARELLPVKADVAIRLVDALRRSGRRAEARAIADSLARALPGHVEMARLAAAIDSTPGAPAAWPARVSDALRAAPR